MSPYSIISKNSLKPMGFIIPVIFAFPVVGHEIKPVLDTFTVVSWNMNLCKSKSQAINK